MKSSNFFIILILLSLSVVAELHTSSNMLSFMSKEELQIFTETVARQIPKHSPQTPEKSPKKILHSKLIEKASPKSKKILQDNEEMTNIIQSELKANTPKLWSLPNRRILQHKSPKAHGSFVNENGTRRSLRFEGDVFKELTNKDCENELKKKNEKENFKRNENNKRNAKESQLKERIEKTKKLSPYATRKALNDLNPLSQGFQIVCEKIIDFRLSQDFKEIKGIVKKRDAIVRKFYEVMPSEKDTGLVYKLIKSDHYSNARERHFFVFKSDVMHLLDLVDEKGRTNKKRLKTGLNIKDMAWHHIGQGITSTEILLLISKKIHQDYHGDLHFSKNDSFVPREGFNIDKAEMNKYLIETLKKL